MANEKVTRTLVAEDGTKLQVVVPASLPSDARGELLRNLYNRYVTHPSGNWKGEAVAVVPPDMETLVAEAMNFMGSTVDTRNRARTDGNVHLYSRGYYYHVGA